MCNPYFVALVLSLIFFPSLAKSEVLAVLGSDQDFSFNWGSVKYISIESLRVDTPIDNSQWKHVGQNIKFLYQVSGSGSPELNGGYLPPGQKSDQYDGNADIFYKNNDQLVSAATIGRFPIYWTGYQPGPNEPSYATSKYFPYSVNFGTGVLNFSQDYPDSTEAEIQIFMKTEFIDNNSAVLPPVANYFIDGSVEVKNLLKSQSYIDAQNTLANELSILNSELNAVAALMSLNGLKSGLVGLLANVQSLLTQVLGSNDTRWATVVLTTVSIMVAALIGGGPGLLLAAAVALMSAYLSVGQYTAEKLANDPPDMGYEEVYSYSTEPIEFDLGLGGGVNDFYAEGAGYLVSVLEAQQGQLASMERAEGAFLQGDMQALAMQMLALDGFYDDYGLYSSLFGDWLTRLPSFLISNGVEVLDPDLLALASISKRTSATLDPGHSVPEPSTLMLVNVGAYLLIAWFSISTPLLKKTSSSRWSTTSYVLHRCVRNFMISTDAANGMALNGLPTTFDSKLAMPNLGPVCGRKTGPGRLLEMVVGTENNR